MDIKKPSAPSDWREGRVRGRQVSYSHLIFHLLLLLLQSKSKWKSKRETP